MTIDERLKALAMSLELLRRDVQAQGKNIDAVLATARQDGENIRALERRIAQRQ